MKNREDDFEIVDLNEAKDLNKKKERKPFWSKKNKNDKTATKTKKKSKNKEFVYVTYAFLFLFMAMALYFVWFVAFKSEDFINSPYNARVSQFSKSTIRGDIISADGKVLATSKVDQNGNETREYPYGSEYAHAVGFASNGMSGAELEANFNLLRSHSFVLNKLVNDIRAYKNQGDTAVLTFDSSLQEVAYNGLGKNDGAVVAIDPQTGKILALVSKPDFDPNTIEAKWDSIANDEESSVLLNRATQGLYPPGSIFKVVTALEYLDEGGTMEDEFLCKGTYTYDGVTVHCYNNIRHGKQTFADAVGNSCNCTFAEIGLEMDIPALNKTCERLLFNRRIPTTLKNVKKSSFVLSKNDPSGIIMQTAFGQGETLVVPLHMAMLTAAIANDGVMMRSYDIDHTQNDAGVLVKQNKPKEAGEIMTPEEAENLQALMRHVVTDGTGKALNVDAYEAYGKTGTAEYNEKRDAHSWFIGYAENDGRQIAVAVVIEGAGAGSSHALPLAKKLFDRYYQ